VPRTNADHETVGEDLLNLEIVISGFSENEHFQKSGRFSKRGKAERKQPLMTKITLSNKRFLQRHKTFSTEMEELSGVNLGLLYVNIIVVNKGRSILWITLFSLFLSITWVIYKGGIDAQLTWEKSG
jgi:hypothetical protein